MRPARESERGITPVARDLGINPVRTPYRPSIQATEYLPKGISWPVLFGSLLPEPVSVRRVGKAGAHGTLGAVGLVHPGERGAIERDAEPGAVGDG